MTFTLCVLVVIVLLLCTQDKRPCCKVCGKPEHKCRCSYEYF